jgi:tRNA nucleotidyltransferase (CCA-adding enzyme)
VYSQQDGFMIITLPADLHPLLETFAHEAATADVGLYLVGGFVRDLVLGKPSTDLDFVVEGDAVMFARRLADRFGGGEIVHHPAFGTATWTPIPGTFPKREIDFATARTETYAAPGALPVVTPARLHDDLSRRDFTINAMAIQLSPTPFGDLVDPFDGLGDLARESLQVLHARSFIDDPTRMLRGIRFESRFGFAFDLDTDALIPDALPYLDVVSGERIQHEIALGFREPEPESVLNGLEALGILERFGLRFDQWQANALLSVRGVRAQMLWGNFPIDLETVYWIILTCDQPDLDSIVDRLRLSRALATQLDQGRHAYLAIPELSYALLPSEVAALLDGTSYAALMAAWGTASRTAGGRDLIVTYAREWRDVKPTLNGGDLIQMGVPAGPKIGRLLARLREAWLDNEITDREGEIRFVENWLKEEQGGDGN